MLFPENLKNTTLVFLVKKTNGIVSELCLARKKRGFGINKWNGVGGKLEPGEAVQEAAIRETQEEIHVGVRGLCKVAELSFYYLHKPDWNQLVHVYLVFDWEGSPAESEEMFPQWFSVSELPFSDMWADDIFWLPEVIQGKLLRAMFVFEEQTITEKNIEIVESFGGNQRLFGRVC